MCKSVKSIFVNLISLHKMAPPGKLTVDLYSALLWAIHL